MRMCSSGVSFADLAQVTSPCALEAHGQGSWASLLTMARAVEGEQEDFPPLCPAQILGRSLMCLARPCYVAAIFEAVVADSEPKPMQAYSLSSADRVRRQHKTEALTSLPEVRHRGQLKRYDLVR